MSDRPPTPRSPERNNLRVITATSHTLHSITEIKNAWTVTDAKREQNSDRNYTERSSRSPGQGRYNQTRHDFNRKNNAIRGHNAVVINEITTPLKGFHSGFNHSYKKEADHAVFHLPPINVTSEDKFQNISDRSQIGCDLTNRHLTRLKTSDRSRSLSPRIARKHLSEELVNSGKLSNSMDLLTIPGRSSRASSKKQHTVVHTTPSDRPPSPQPRVAGDTSRNIVNGGRGGRPLSNSEEFNRSSPSGSGKRTPASVSPKAVSPVVTRRVVRSQPPASRESSPDTRELPPEDDCRQRPALMRQLTADRLLDICISEASDESRGLYRAPLPEPSSAYSAVMTELGSDTGEESDPEMQVSLQRAKALLLDRPAHGALLRKKSPGRLMGRRGSISAPTSPLPQRRVHWGNDG